MLVWWVLLNSVFIISIGWTCWGIAIILLLFLILLVYLDMAILLLFLKYWRRILTAVHQVIVIAIERVVKNVRLRRIIGVKILRKSWRALYQRRISVIIKDLGSSPIITVHVIVAAFILLSLTTGGFIALTHPVNVCSCISWGFMIVAFFVLRLRILGLTNPVTFFLLTWTSLWISIIVVSLLLLVFQLIWIGYLVLRTWIGTRIVVWLRLRLRPWIYVRNCISRLKGKSLTSKMLTISIRVVISLYKNDKRELKKTYK